MAFLITTIRKVEREIYDDIFWAGGQVVEIKPAPIIAFFDIEILIANDTMIFEAEIRKSRDDIQQVDWDDELNYLVTEHSKIKGKISTHTKQRDNHGLLLKAIVNINENQPVDFPILIDTI